MEGQVPEGPSYQEEGKQLDVAQQNNSEEVKSPENRNEPYTYETSEDLSSQSITYNTAKVVSNSNTMEYDWADDDNPRDKPKNSEAVDVELSDETPPSSEGPRSSNKTSSNYNTEESKKANSSENEEMAKEGDEVLETQQLRVNQNIIDDGEPDSSVSILTMSEHL